HGRAAVVTMRITDTHVTVRRDARADMRWRTLLGGSPYIDLDPGSASRPPLRDAVLPSSRTASQVELDQFLGAFKRQTPEAIRNILQQMSRGLTDRPAVARPIRALSPSLTPVHRGDQPLLRERPDDLGVLQAS